MNRFEKGLLALSTLPHLCILTVSPSSFYSYLVVSSTTLSVAWHASEGNQISTLAVLDNGLGLFWGLTDLALAWPTSNFAAVLNLNAAIFLLNIYVNYLDKHRQYPYSLGHSFWHILSVLKCLWVAQLLSSSSLEGSG